MHKLSRRQTLASILAAGASAAVPSTRAAHADGTTARVSFLLVNEDCHLICVHAGDTLSPSLLSSFDQGAHMVDLFNDVGLDAFVPGNHEFDFGKEVYFDR